MIEYDPRPPFDAKKKLEAKLLILLVPEKREIHPAVRCFIHQVGRQVGTELAMTVLIARAFARPGGSQ
ncbi:hypothetical protein [Bradyrhizobium sp.]|uniref:hypothetical protein n=1 Tax=Bradyrhizobium sp. TaxID=376 RepID=UPI003C734A35